MYMVVNSGVLNLTSLRLTLKKKGDHKYGDDFTVPL